MHHFLVKIKSTFAVFLVLLILGLGFASVAEAATLYLSPSSSSSSVGNIVTVKVLVDTQGRAINNSDGIIQFPADSLEVLSISKNQSIFSIWVEEPKFSNNEGTISYNGGIPNPGYTGANGEILTATFKVKKTGPASIVFSDSTVRENDGRGTDILSSKLPATIQIGPAVVDTPVLPVVSSLPPKPIVKSLTHPEQDGWYSETTGTFSWTVPAGVTSLQTILSKNPAAVPSITYDRSVSQRTVTTLSDGILYFHVRYLNNVGWGPTAHYKIQIDTTPPELSSLRVENVDGRDVVTFASKDSLSGIERYELSIDDQASIELKTSEGNPQYVLPVQNPSTHRLTVVAFDKAGNKSEITTSFDSSPIKEPTIHVAEKEISNGKTVTITGQTDYPNSGVEILLQIGEKQLGLLQNVTAEDGTFTVVSDEIKESGTVKVTAQLVFSESVRSPYSQPVFVQVNDFYVIKVSKEVIRALTYIIPAVLMLFALLVLVYLGWHKFFNLKKRLRKDLEETAAGVHKAVALYKSELARQLEKLERARVDEGLNKEEERVFKELKNSIDDIDLFIDKKLKKFK